MRKSLQSQCILILLWVLERSQASSCHARFDLYPIKVHFEIDYLMIFLFDTADLGTLMKVFV